MQAIRDRVPALCSVEGVREFMQLDFEVQRFSRVCAATERPLEPGETFYSVLESHGAEIVRKDYSADAWQGPPDSAFAWWNARVPEPAARRARLAPNEVLLELFDQLAEQPAADDMRYVLALLLVRRRVFRLLEADDPRHPDAIAASHDEAETPPAHIAAAADHDVPLAGGNRVVVHCPLREETYALPEATPDAARAQEIQAYLSEILFADAQ